MATVHAAPIPAPAYSRYTYREDEKAYLAALSKRAREQHPNRPLVGEVVRFQIADGYAVYVVWNTTPLELVHVDLGDAYSIPAAHARGLRVSDIQESVDWEKRWRKALS